MRKKLQTLRNRTLFGLLALTIATVVTQSTVAQEAPEPISLCADLSLFPNGTPLPGPDFRYSGFVFRQGGGASSLDIRTSGSARGLAIPENGGLEVALPVQVSSVDFRVGPGNAPIDVSALDLNRNVIAQLTIPSAATPASDELSDNEIAFLLFEGGSNENVVVEVCVAVQVLAGSAE